MLGSFQASGSPLPSAQLLTTIVWLGIFFLLLNDEDKDAAPDRMYHVSHSTARGNAHSGAGLR